MRPLSSAALIIGVAAATVLSLTGTAHASVSSSDWTAVPLSSSYFADLGDPSPVSCVQGTDFCAVITTDSNNLDGSVIGNTALVTRNGGRTWSGYPMPALFSQVQSISCVSASICWAAGQGAEALPGLAETTDGGRTWMNMTPATWSSAQRWPNAIDCLSATTCWIAGQNNVGSIGDPWLAKTSDGGATWSTFTELPGSDATSLSTAYQLYGLSCTSATTCIAVGGSNRAPSEASVLATRNGGRSWTRTELPGADTLFGISCVQGAAGGWFFSPPAATCVAVGNAGSAGAESVVITSDNGGSTWSAAQDFDNGGWFASAACLTAKDCWIGGAGTTQALIGTVNGGSSWTSVSADTTNEEVYVSCLSRSVCVATIGNGLYVTDDDGGLAG
jgi:hypothetical protein